MFQRLTTYIAGGALFTVSGLNLDRLIKKLTESGFILRDLCRPSHRELRFTAPYHSRKKLILALNREGCQFSQKTLGLPAVIKKLAARWGLIAGFILCVASVAVYSGYIWDIRVEGTERIKTAEVTAVLTEMGVRGGIRKSQIDRTAVALTLNTRLSDAADVTAEIRGTCLIIRINETLVKDGAEDAVSQNIIAAYDAIIEKVLVFDGTALVKAGDVVKKGAILIAGYNLDNEGNMTETKAKGEVAGKVYFTAENVFFTEREEYVRTGNVTETRFIGLSGFNIKIKNKGSPYSLFEKETGTRYIYKSFFLPLIETTERCFELGITTANYDYSQYKDAIISNLRAEAEAKVPASAKVLSSKIDVRQIDKYVVTMYNIETEILL